MSNDNVNIKSIATRVLLVDDDPTFAKIIRMELEKYQQKKFVINWLNSVESALSELIINKEYDVILTDYYFPTSNGLELCLQLNQMGVSIPIIFLTSSSDFKLAVEAMKLGVEEFLLKSDLDRKHLPRTISSVLERVKFRKHKLAVEKRLAMAENRAQAIRELVVTVCHEFNNPLAAVKISFDLLQRQNLTHLNKDVIADFENQFRTIDIEIKSLRDLNFEKYDFRSSVKNNYV